MSHADPRLEDTELSSRNMHLYPQPAITTHWPARRSGFSVLDPDAKRPTSFSDPQVVAQQREKRAAIERAKDLATTTESLRIAEAVAAASANARDHGHTEGFRDGFKSGTHWGMFVGAFGTCLIVAIVVVGLVLHVGRRIPLF